VGKLIAIEGRDGAGKNTVTNQLAEQLVGLGYSVAKIAFPKYATNIAGKALGDFLAGRSNNPDDPRVVATLYGLDRFESIGEIKTLMDTHDFLISDRYIGSNLAYQGAKVADEQSKAMIDWIYNLEINMYGLPVPFLNVFLDTDLNVSKSNVAKKNKRDYTDLEYDVHEKDNDLQSRVRNLYLALSDNQTLGPWVVVNTTENAAMRPPAEIAAQITDEIQRIKTS